MDVPEGIATVVLDWVAEDPARAQAALDAEYMAPTPRSTLIAKLQSIAAKPAQEEAMTETPVEEQPAPEVPEPAVDLADNATHVGPRNQRTAEIEVPEDAFDTVAAQAKADDEEAPVEAEPVDYFQLASNQSGVALRVDDSVHLFDHSQALALSRDLRQALANVTY